MATRGKDQAAKLHEKHQTILMDLLRDEDNRYCADCLAKGPRWASWNLGVFVCIRCAGIHRNLGVHISRVKSVNLDSWTPEQIEAIQRGGNAKAKALYECNLPANFRRPQDDYSVEVFIRSKYERKLYIAKGEQPKKPEQDRSKVRKEARSERRVTSSTEKHKADQLASLPRPASSSARSNTSPKPSPPSQPSQPSQPSHSLPPDLISLASTQDGRARAQPAVDLLTNLPSPPPASQNQQPSFDMESKPQDNVKDTIMSLYSSRPQYGAYTAQGMPVNAYYYQQQQAAAMRMMQQQQLQVRQVQEQMQQLKLRQQHPPVAVGNGGIPSSNPGGGHTLNPHLW